LEDAVGLHITKLRDSLLDLGSFLLLLALHLGEAILEELDKFLGDFSTYRQLRRGAWSEIHYCPPGYRMPVISWVRVGDSQILCDELQLGEHETEYSTVQY
jgi:hypothetical protein